MKIRTVGAELFHAGGWTDRWTCMKKLTATLRNFANVPKNSLSYPQSAFLCVVWTSKSAAIFFRVRHQLTGF